MAKALYGHLATADPRLVAELTVLRRRVADLEAENIALRTDLAELTDMTDLPDDLRSIVNEPLSV